MQQLPIERAFREIGDKVVIYDPVTIIKPEVITLKSNIIISEYVYLAGGQGTYLGNYIHLSAHSVISGGGVFVAEDFVGLSAGVTIITGSEDIMGKGLTNPTVPLAYRAYYRSHVILKKHAFLATNVIVHPGVTIGEGAVVGSGSVVTKDLEPWGVYVGTPAKRIRDRDRDTMLRLEEELRAEYPYDPADFTDIIAQCTKK